MTQRLPVPGSDNGTWGDILNGFLEVSLNSDGSLNTTAVTTALPNPIPTSNLGSGTASSSTYLRGDGTWSTPPTATNATTSAPGLIQLSGDLGGSGSSAIAPLLASTANVNSVVSGIINTNSTVTAKAPLASPTFTGTVTGGGITRSVSLVVAANNASTQEKAQADYVCTGTSDQNTINTAISALSANGGSIHLSAGTFNISGSINLNQNYVKLQGTGLNATLLNATTANPIIQYTGSVNIIFCSVEAMMLQGNATATYGIYIAPSGAATFWDFVARDVIVVGTTSDGFYAYDGHGYVLDHFLAESTGGYGVNFSNSAVEEAEVRNGTFKANAGGAIHMGCPGGIVAENEIASTTGNAIELYGAGSKAINNWIGVDAAGPTVYGISLHAKGCIAMGNVVNQCGSHGIYLYNSECIIIGNFVTGNTGTGIYGSAATIQGNYVGDGSSYGIELATGSYGVIGGNFVYNNTLSGIYVSSAVNVSVTGNTIQVNGQYGILSNSTGTVVQGNVLYNNSRTTINTYDEINTSGSNTVVSANTINGNSQSRYGVNFSGSSSTGNMSAFNIISGEETASTTSSTYAVVWNPLPVVTKTGSYFLGGADGIVVFTITASATATLPSAVTAGAGRPYTIVNASASALALTLTASAGTVPSASIAAGTSQRIISDGTNWQAA